MHLRWNLEQNHLASKPKNQHQLSEYFMMFFSLQWIALDRYFCSEQQYRSFSIGHLNLCCLRFNNTLFLFYCNFSSNHTVHLSTVANFSAGQRILVQGKLRSTNLTLEDGKKMTSSVIKAYQLYVLTDGASTESNEGDQNQVELLAHIASNITEKDTLSTFAVATNYEIR